MSRSVADEKQECESPDNRIFLALFVTFKLSDSDAPKATSKDFN